MEGIGTYTFKNGSAYIGHFQDNKFHGHGKLIDKFNDMIIIGQFVNGKAEGTGRILYGGSEHYQAQNQHHGSKVESMPRGEYEG